MEGIIIGTGIGVLISGLIRVVILGIETAIEDRRYKRYVKIIKDINIQPIPMFKPAVALRRFVPSTYFEAIQEKINRNQETNQCQEK